MSLIFPQLSLSRIESGRDRDWPEMEQIFAGLPALKLGQAWLAENEPGFRDATVRAGICDGRLAIHAELIDDDIYNSSCSLNERTWTMGDVFEIFLRSEKADKYYEFHVTPENQKLQLHFSSETEFRAKLPWGTHCLTPELFYSATQVEEGRWRVYAEVPLALLGGGPWRFSFCRYDVTRGSSKVVVSSTSLHRKLDFHRPGEWGWMEEVTAGPAAQPTGIL